MTKTVSAGLKTTIGRQVVPIRSFFKVKLVNGTIIAATDHDGPIATSVDSDGVVTYKAKTGLSPSAVEQSGELNVDRDTFQGLIESDDVTVEDIRAGLYRGAEVKTFKMVPSNPGDIIKLRQGTIGEIKRRGKLWMAEVDGRMAAYRRKIIDVIDLSCQWQLGDSKCQAQIDPGFWSPSTAYTARTDHDDATGSHVLPTLGTDDLSKIDRQFRCITSGTSGATEPSWNTTIGGTTNDGSVVWETIQSRRVRLQVISWDISSPRTFDTDYSFGDAPDSWFRGGLVEMIPAGNVNQIQDIKNFISNTDGTTTIELYEPFPFALSLGDTFDLVAACKKTRAACRDDFDNMFNHGGFPDVPHNDQFFFVPPIPAA